MSLKTALADQTSAVSFQHCNYLTICLSHPSFLFIICYIDLCLPFKQIIGHSRQDGTFIRLKIIGSQQLFRNIEDVVVQIIAFYCKCSEGRCVFEPQQKYESNVDNPQSEVTSEDLTDYIDSCLQRHTRTMVVFRSLGIREEFKNINKTCLQKMVRNTYFISRTSSKCFLLSARRLVKWVSFSAKDC